MSFIDSITPKDTEEIKPGLFIQKKLGKYRQISPAAWDGKINYKNFLLGANPIRNLFWFALLMFLAWSYFHDVAEYRDFYMEINSGAERCYEICENMESYNSLDEVQKEENEPFEYSNPLPGYP